MTRQEIARQTYEITPHSLTEPLICDVCAATEVQRLVSREIVRGRMYIVGRDSPAFKPSAVLAFCADCWPKWLLWRARMGFDLHFHRSDAICSARCIARRDGRRLQFEAQASIVEARHHGFFAMKSIDGLPLVNGSFALIGLRTHRFMRRRGQRQTYYESIGDAREVQRQFMRLGNLLALGVPRALLDRFVIVVQAFESWYTAPSGNVSLPRAGDRSIGLHCVALTHYENHAESIGFANSWGRGWGNGGYGKLSIEYLERHFHEAFVTRRARFFPPPWNFTSWPDPMSPGERRRRLLLQAPRQIPWRRRAKGENWAIEVYEVASPTTGEFVLCVDVRNGFGLRMGWAFLRYREASGGILEIPELFVWPTFRRMGIGRMLEDVALDYAESWEVGEIHLMMNEADAVIGAPRAAARLFGNALGYEWHWRPESAPRRAGTGIKRVVPHACRRKE